MCSYLLVPSLIWFWWPKKPKAKDHSLKPYSDRRRASLFASYASSAFGAFLGWRDFTREWTYFCFFFVIGCMWYWSSSLDSSSICSKLVEKKMQPRPRYYLLADLIFFHFFFSSNIALKNDIKWEGALLLDQTLLLCLQLGNILIKRRSYISLLSRKSIILLDTIQQTIWRTFSPVNTIVIWSMSCHISLHECCL